MRKNIGDLTHKPIDYSEIPDLSQVSMAIRAQFIPQHDGHDASRLHDLLTQLRNKAQKAQ
ncbi:hypothetical protein SAMN00768000_3577 [Sulfobacillus thermosulfidooxidans DSM 9293]|uniref:Uncharacterized protein n=3 Tax=Sulfobacillus TaxID=28033 RepID=A0A1W1WNT1_SULTA|nr:hypothetical protein [Sulfobacillus thermosulfidooxidans]PSR19926.1 MAG: hypothetical protein C7B45_17495 [Sulfobacillus acidophilus]PSR25437.1 MAG: hypothetical protein C7B47_12340 [Sulfobacillus thermosulfidooxidans]SMC07988.1 hypothetical protein SAMN00768000_3577 [Sulfobacillus thermosulfidooxidans DSM 9293]